MPRIIIINYGMGNIRNVQRGLQSSYSIKLLKEHLFLEFVLDCNSYLLKAQKMGYTKD
jgi:imidazoleglycerol phosphate synthase glutamine amidotransferase subunit HisH